MSWWQVTAIDFSGEMLEHAQQRSVDWAAGLPLQASIKWIQGDALQLPCRSAEYDAATIGYGLRNVADIPLAMSELCRVLKPGAKAAILDFNRSANPVVNGLQSWALQNIVVPTAASYGLSQEYKYLQPSIERFPTGKLCLMQTAQAIFLHQSLLITPQSS